MPPKGGNAALSDDEVMSAVMHMLRVASSGNTTVVTQSAGKSTAPPQLSPGKGRSVYQASCSACHATGAAGAPKLGDTSAWASRLGSGMASLYNSALKGKGAMPAKGGNAGLADADVKAAADFMVGQSRGTGSAAATRQDVKATAPAVAAGGAGKSVYQATCVACHGTGIAGAPKAGDSAAWAARVKAGNASMYASAIRGKGAMPPKGGNGAWPTTT